MKQNIFYGVAFIAGVAIGGVVSWKLLEKRYSVIAQEEIDSVKEYYSSKYNENNDISEEEIDAQAEAAERARKKPPINSIYTEYEKVTTNYKAEEESSMKNVREEKKPYTIAPDEYEEGNGYAKVDLTFYEGDGILVADNSEEPLIPDDIIGPDALNKFGEFEPDVLYVRDDSISTDYEVTLDPRRYADVTGLGN